MGCARFEAAPAGGRRLAYALSAAALLFFPTLGHAQVIQSVTCLVTGGAQNGINTGGISASYPGNASGSTYATAYAQSLGANGAGGYDTAVEGGAAGNVSLTTDGTISAPDGTAAAVLGLGGLYLPQSAVVWAQSLGGCGNVATGHYVGQGGTAGSVTVTANAGTVIELGSNTAGIYALSAGGQGGAYTQDLTHLVGAGGTGGDVTVTFAGSLNGQGADDAYGIYALSVGGSSGATDSAYSALGGYAGTVNVTLASGASIAMSGDGSIAVFAASVGGLSWYADNGTDWGHQNGNGGEVTVDAQPNVAITTSGELGIGILALSTGGNSSPDLTPPDSLQDHGENAKPQDYAPAGNAGAVTVNSAATITTEGDVAIGIAAVSATGGRGAGQLLEKAEDGSYVIDQVGQVGPGGGSPGTVTVVNSGTISTSGVGAMGILGLSLGGSGGVMDSKPGLLNFLGGTTAGTGSTGGTVTITDSGSISTTGIAAIGILAQSVGGGGGTTTGTSGVIAVGTNGGVGGDGGLVDVEKLGGALTTGGDGAFGILAQSIGGGGGNGANATGLAASVGGQGGASGTGGEVDVTLQASTLLTAGDFAVGIGAQSIGGGGGNGGYAKTYSTSAISAAIGGTGSGGGAGGTVDIATTGSSVTTSGAHAAAVLAQSIGGGGGNGGAAAVYTANAGVTVTTAIGGDAGDGGAGGTVTVNGTGTTYATSGMDSIGILAQSIGGGGGNGGSALARSETLPAGTEWQISVDTAVGGTGGGGGAGGTVIVTNTGTAVAGGSTGTIATDDDGSTGVLAQSIGGGGGNGGDSSAFARSVEGASSSIKVSVAVGGAGGQGGDGGAVSVNNGGAAPCGADGCDTGSCDASCVGTILTQGNNAAGLLAQSIGGGGGNGAVGNGSVSSPNLGTETGTSYDTAIAIGGDGSDGGTGATVTVANSAGSLIRTYGSGSQGILAQSIGGGGGNAGGGVATGSGDSIVMNVAVGGSGGSGATGGTVSVTNDGAISTGQLVADQGSGGTYTTGGDAVGILAQSIGGGGGTGGSSDAAATISALFQIEDLLNAPSNSYSFSLAVGGSGGGGGDGGTVTVDNEGSVTTLGERAHGILAQAIGGGGGSAGTATVAANSIVAGPVDDKSGNYALTVSVGGSGGAGGNGGTVNVEGDGSVLTAGYGAIGILAQSIGGGGGVGAEGTVDNTTTMGLGAGWNGSGSAAGHGGSVTVTAGTVTTLGDDAHAIVAQSIGGGGGLGSAGCSNSTQASTSGIAATLCFGNPAGTTGSFAPWNDASSFTIHMGGGSGASGAGGDVAVNVDDALSTSGARSIGVIAQSIGGGGGLVTVAAANTHAVNLQARAGANDGASGTVTVTQATGASIATTGDGGWGILAQSLYGGGGFAGDPSLSIGSLTANQLSSPDKVVDSNGNIISAGNVVVDLYGSISTTGANAHGVVAQSVGGGGGIANSPDNSSLAFGNSATINGTSEGQYVATAGAVSVTVEAGASIKAAGAGSIGILAQSTGVIHGDNDYAPINITINGSVLGGTMAGFSGTIGAAGLVLSGGGYGTWAQWDTENQVVIGATGSLGTVDGINGTALAGYYGATNVVNNGTITGRVELGTSGMLWNNDTGTLNTGTIIDVGKIDNDGTINIGGTGKVATTTLTGWLESSGTLAIDIDALATQKADMLSVLGGEAWLVTVVPTAKALLPGSYEFLSVASGNALSVATVPSTLLFDWSVDIDAGTNTAALTPTADFAPAGVTLTPGEASFATYLGTAWANADAGLAPLFGALSQIGDGSSYSAAITALSPEASQAQATALLNNAGTILGAALSCPVFVTSGTLLGEDECAWAKVAGSWMSQSQTRDTQGFDVSQVIYRLGAQKELVPGWYLGGSLGAGPTSSSSDNGSNGSGYTVDGSVSLKHVAGPWLFAGSLALAYGDYSNSRLVQLPVDGMAPAVLDSDTSMTFVAGRLRAGYEFTFPNWYIRPYADLDVVYANAPGYREQGGSIYALEVQGSDYAGVIVSPMVEIGGRYDLDDLILRPFLTAGVSFSSNDSRVVSARFAGASARDGTFQTYLNSPAVLGTISAGLDLYKAGGFELKAEYGFSAGDSFQVQSGSVRFAYHF
ncbi:autotransporter outer membrane beta-barrel domain-containing protein [Ancylobacter oerskovii]|uniref:Autotransporter outer membrane beta-barrel domain-containing protein n=1 Tax=Ancylobacter oerskovii TaxID=459519 RepID=A0ABW4Z017_9HYPH|nr:autotransporter outer membrane beta-barrel domain-containing protein [Ancylobacter oerskovii]MBS7543819.1 hypothetical protein [Ancylobacter oerskovii]